MMTECVVELCDHRVGDAVLPKAHDGLERMSLAFERLQLLTIQNLICVSTVDRGGLIARNKVQSLGKCEWPSWLAGDPGRVGAFGGRQSSPVAVYSGKRSDGCHAPVGAYGGAYR